MNTSKSIIIGCSLVAASVLTHLSYSIRRDQVATESQRQEQERTRKSQADAYRASQAKAAWDSAIVGLDYNLQRWIESNADLRSGEHIKLPFVFVKTFNFTDVQWVDDRHVRVSGYVGASNAKMEQWFSWVKNMRLTDEGNWTDPKAHAAFASVTPTKAQMDSWLIREIRIPN